MYHCHGLDPMEIFAHLCLIKQVYRYQKKVIHGFTIYLIIGFIVIHLAGVFLGERQQGQDIVSDMVNGGETKSDQN
jgi:cytochrome b